MQAGGAPSQGRAQSCRCATCCLDSARVEHHAHAPADRLGRQVLAELRAHDAAVAVWPADLTPDHAEARAVNLPLRLVDVREPGRRQSARRAACGAAQQAGSASTSTRDRAREAHVRASASAPCARSASERPTAWRACTRAPLAQVEVHGAALVDAVDFDERGVVCLVLLRPLVAQDGALAPQPDGLASALLLVDAHLTRAHAGLVDRGPALSRGPPPGPIGIGECASGPPCPAGQSKKTGRCVSAGRRRWRAARPECARASGPGGARRAPRMGASAHTLGSAWEKSAISLRRARRAAPGRAMCAGRAFAAKPSARCCVRPSP